MVRPPRLLTVPMKYCRVFWLFCCPSSRWKYAHVCLSEPPKRSRCFPTIQLASSRRSKPWEFHMRVRDPWVSMFTGTNCVFTLSPPGTNAAGVIEGRSEEHTSELQSHS